MQKTRSIQVGKKRQSIEQRLELLEKRVSRIERRDGLALFLDQPLPAPIVRKKPGPKSELSDYQLVHRRDSIFNFLCNNWPEIRVLLRRARSADGLRREIKARYDNEREWSESGRAFVVGIDALWGYSRSYRYSDNPEQVANAMAGCPELAWRTSLNRCQRNPTKISLGIRAWRLYLKRKHPDLLKLLDDATSPDKIRGVLLQTRSKDEVILGMKNNPAMVKEWLTWGRPSVS